jgi:hypothetical protein
MKVIEKEQVHKVLNFKDLIPALDKGFAGDFNMPKRQVFELAPGCEKHNAFAVLPAWNEEVIGVKSFTYFPQNSDVGFDSLYSKIMLFSREHGVGLFLHEAPIIGPNCDYVLEPGNIITIEPGIYIPDFGGVRLEDDLLITDDDFQVLTHAPKPFVI